MLNAHSDDSIRDVAIAGLLSNFGQTFETFVMEIESLERRRPEKKTRIDYLRATWDYAREKNDTVNRTHLTDDDIDELRNALNESSLTSLPRRQRDVLEWAVNEAIARRSWTIVPGVTKIGKALSIDPSDVSGHLRALAYQEHLLNYRHKGGWESAKEISVRPLVYPDAAEPEDALPQSRTRSRPPSNTRLTLPSAHQGP